MTEKNEAAQNDIMTVNVGSYADMVDNAMAELADNEIIERIWKSDHTVWKPDPTEIVNRLGWLDIATRMKESIPRIAAVADAVWADGYTHALVLGMGGSSLCPEVLGRTFGAKQGALNLAVLDSTDPGAVIAYAEELDIPRTLFIVSTKSGGTVETLSFFRYFYNRVIEAVGEKHAGDHFLAITDPDSKLTGIGEQYGFRSTFINDPNIGGRYSALSHFGLVPASLIGLDIPVLLERATSAMNNARENTGTTNNAALLGVIMATLAKAGRDKLTLIISRSIISFGDWAEQLLAESTGKNGNGILPVVGEIPSAPEAYGSDRLFIHLRMAGDTARDETMKALIEAGHPVVTLHLDDAYDLGGQFFMWEMATAVAGSILGINPFDQPDVEAAKILAREMVAAYRRKGSLPELNCSLQDSDLEIYGTVDATRPREALSVFLKHAGPGSYVAVHTYLRSTSETDTALLALRNRMRDTTKAAVTIGYGPRFLHSTGQLHKGDAGNGLFIQLTAEDPRDADIPDNAGSQESAITFGVLKAAQALGDRQALLDKQRKVLRFHFKTNPIKGLQFLRESLP